MAARPTLIHGVAALLWLGAAAGARADDFDLRIGAANAFTRLKPGAAYQQTLAPFVQAAIAACLPPGGAPAPADQGQLILVANVRPDGRVTTEDVRPVNAVSTCFAQAFGRETLQKPPVPPGGAFVYPIVVQLDITP